MKAKHYVEPEVCIEIDQHTEREILTQDERYLDGLITKEELAMGVANCVFKYVRKHKVVLVKIFKNRR